MSNLFIMMGAPGSGKSTYLKHHANGKVISREIILKYHLFFQENIYYEDIALFPYMCAYLCHYIYINKEL